MAKKKTKIVNIVNDRKVKCRSCGGEAYKEGDFCYGCERVICLKCMGRYDHVLFGAHRVKPKPRKKKR
jgi:hypothetical protein